MFFDDKKKVRINFVFVHRVEDVERRPLFLQIKLFCYNILIIKKYFIVLNYYFMRFLSSI